MIRLTISVTSGQWAESWNGSSFWTGEDQDSEPELLSYQISLMTQITEHGGVYKAPSIMITIGEKWGTTLLQNSLHQLCVRVDFHYTRSIIGQGVRSAVLRPQLDRQHAGPGDELHDRARDHS